MPKAKKVKRKMVYMSFQPVLIAKSVSLDVGILSLLMKNDILTVRNTFFSITSG